MKIVRISLPKSFAGYYLYYMKNNKAEKRMVVCIPEELFEKFQQVCDANYKSMSEAVRDFIQTYIAEYQTKLMNRILDTRQVASWAIEKAATAWCQPTTENKVMDPVLAMEFAKILQDTKENIGDK